MSIKHDKLRLPAAIFLLFAVLAAGLYLLPRQGSAQMEVHGAVIASLKAGNLWGRQAFAGSLNYPVFQNFALLLFDMAGSILRLDAARLLVAACQAVVIMRILGIFMQRKAWPFIAAPLVALLLLPVISVPFHTLDAGWAMAVPASAVFCRIFTGKTEQLEGLVLTSIDCGLLCLCGTPGIIIGVSSAIALYFIEKKRREELHEPANGLRFLLWLAPAYCLLLWMLWNWLIMGDALFLFRDATLRLLSADFKSCALRPGMLCMLAFMFPMFICASRSLKRQLGALLLVQSLLLLGLQFTRQAAGSAQTGASVLQTLLVLELCVLASCSGFVSKVPRSSCLMAMLCCFYIACRAEHFTGVRMPGYSQCNHPPHDEITSQIDRYWPDSRVFLIGERLPALYSDTDEKRFVARLDFQEQSMLEQSADEQMHLLLPPADGSFYPSGVGMLADIHRNGRNWLLLEKQWKSGWQLWRIVSTPANASKLDFLREAGHKTNQ